MLILGTLYAFGEEKNGKKAIKWCTKAAKEGNVLSMCTLGKIYRDGEIVERDIKKAIKWYSKAAELGYEQANIHIGEIYLYGIGIEKNLEEAEKWFEKTDKTF